MCSTPAFNRRINRRIVSAFLIAALCGIPSVVNAQYPARPIRLVVGLAQGGGPDVAARIISGRLSAALGQPVVVENRTGSAGNIGTEVVARSSPDGYVLLMSNDSMMSINPHIYKMPVDVMRDLTPVAPVSQTSNFFLTVHPAVPAKTFREFIDYAKRANPPLAYASVGYGSQHHIAMEMLKARAGINLLHVPYKGGAPAATATLAGETAVMIGGVSSVSFMTDGRLRGLAATGRSRSALYPELPIISEFYPGYELATWIGIFGPSSLSEAIGARLNGEINKALTAPDITRNFNTAGIEPYVATRAEFGERVRADYEKYGKLVKQFGIKLDD